MRTHFNVCPLVYATALREVVWYNVLLVFFVMVIQNNPVATIRLFRRRFFLRSIEGKFP